MFAARPVPATSSAGCCCKACAGRIVCWLFCCKACAGHFIGWLFYCKACAGHFICWLMLQSLCRPDRLLAVAARPVPVVHLPAVCFKACAGHFICRQCLLQRPCHAMPCLPAFALAPCLLPLVHQPPFCFAVPPLFIAMCARILAQICRDCSDGSCNTGLHRRPVHRLSVHCTHLKGGGLGTAYEQPATCPVACSGC